MVVIGYRYISCEDGKIDLKKVVELNFDRLFIGLWRLRVDGVLLDGND